MNAFLDALGRFCARRHWWVLLAWLVVVAALLLLRNAFGGEFVNDYTVTGSQSSTGLAVLDKDFPQQGGYAGQIVFHAKSGALSDKADVINTAMTQRRQAARRHPLGQPVRDGELAAGVQGRHDRLRHGRLERRAGLARRLLPRQARRRRRAGALGRAAGRVRRRRRADRPDDRRQELRDHRPELRPVAAAVHVRLDRGGRACRWCPPCSACCPGCRWSACSRPR